MSAGWSGRGQDKPLCASLEKTVVSYCVRMRLIGNPAQRGSPIPTWGRTWPTHSGSAVGTLELTHNYNLEPDQSLSQQRPLYLPLGDPGTERFGLYLQDKSPCSAFPIMAEKVPSYIIKSPVKGP